MNPHAHPANKPQAGFKEPTTLQQQNENNDSPIPPIDILTHTLLELAHCGGVAGDFRNN
jgi:hypothetical protein